MTATDDIDARRRTAPSAASAGGARDAPHPAFHDEPAPPPLGLAIVILLMDWRIALPLLLAVTVLVVIASL